MKRGRTSTLHTELGMETRHNHSILREVDSPGEQQLGLVSVEQQEGARLRGAEETIAAHVHEAGILSIRNDHVCTPLLFQPTKHTSTILHFIPIGPQSDQ